MTPAVKVVDVWGQSSHIYYEIFHNGIQYFLSRHDLEAYLSTHNLTAEMKIDRHRYTSSGGDAEMTAGDVVYAE